MLTLFCQTLTEDKVGIYFPI